ncbi:AAA family ATPase [Leptospira idonii]|uniref:AAA domain-containing protein n=1 Tax=Leptospira idonii TaxID=1193500 RepID=A0A4R9M5I0_9LEPT|nr:AAA family ATPase [Leptospira idonii]TGN20957.1 hypothetical protein EHS15_00085 [Leptospira idonii]
MAAGKNQKFQSIIEYLQTNGKESEIDSRLVEPFLNFLGFPKEEFKSHPSGDTRKEADFVAYLDGAPYIVVESKSNSINLSDFSLDSYKKAKFQLYGYLKSDKFNAAKFGVLLNGKNIQVFQRKDNLIFPLTPILSFGKQADKVFNDLKKILKKPQSNIPEHKTAIITVYNNKGGVGKTVTVGNLGGVLANMGKRVLLVDLDPQQRDLSDSFKLGNIASHTSIFDVLFDAKIEKAISAKKINSNLYIIPGDERFDDPNHSAKKVTASIVKKFRKVLEGFGKKGLFDYILIDCPTNWSFFSKSGVSVADAVLIPVNYQAAQAIHNAVQVLDKFIPEVWKERSGNGPEILSILFNNAYTDKTSEKHFEEVRKDEIRKLTKGKWYSDLFESNVEIKHYHEISTQLFLYINEAGPSPLTVRKPHSKISQEYEQVAKKLLELT